MSAGYTPEEVEHMKELIIPKLDAIGSGNGSYVHRANQLAASIKGWFRLAKESNTMVDIVTCREYIRTAEMWLAKIAYKGIEK